MKVLALPCFFFWKMVNKINKCFFYNSDKIKNELIVDMVTFLRKSLILSSLPITRYADSGKNFFLDLLYDNYIGNARENAAYLEDIRLNAKGYELLATHQMNKR